MQSESGLSASRGPASTGQMMFKRGDVFENPVTGERLTIRLGTRESLGERLIVDTVLRGPGSGSALHIHPSIRERVTVMSGHVGICVGGMTTIAKLGKPIDIAPGVRHGFWNAGICEARVTTDIRPANRFEAYKFEAFLRNMIGLAQDGKTDAKGVPNLLQLSLITSEFEDVIQLATPAPMVRRILFPLLRPIARLRGYKSSYRQYIFRRPSERVPNEVKPPALHFSSRAALNRN
jgi:quercetin dioxygenase-like cupin family protein